MREFASRPDAPRLQNHSIDDASPCVYCGYPPDLRAEAVKLVLEQAEALCEEWVG